MDWLQTALQPAFLTGVFWGLYRTPDAEKNWPDINKNIAYCSQYMQLLDKQLQNKLFLTGDRLTLADITVGTVLFRYFELEIERPAVPNVESFYKRLQKRAAYREHVMVSFEDMKA